MLHFSISLRALVFALLLGIVVFTGSDVAQSAPLAAEQTGFDGMLFTNPGQNNARDVHTDSDNPNGPNNGGIRIYTGKTLTNPPTTAALQFYGTGHTVFPGQAFIDSASHANAAIIFRTAAAGGVAERMRITAGGNIGIGTSETGSSKLVVASGAGSGILVEGNSPFSMMSGNNGGSGSGLYGNSYTGTAIHGISSGGWAGYFDGTVQGRYLPHHTEQLH